MELNSLLPSILWLNSIILIGFILIQNESAKDSVTTSTSSSSMNPFEKFTWGSLILQFSLLLIKIKTNDF
jgi:preprotein translocase subunit SecG|tara:strand:- start:2349 stop:2558 length:210 start_codon:yes stop_codon:yes gene_type:complete